MNNHSPKLFAKGLLFAAGITTVMMGLFAPQAKATLHFFDVDLSVCVAEIIAI
jgi:hypothetical protein